MLSVRGYTVAAYVISIGGILNGYDTGVVGAVTTMPQFEDDFGILSPALRGFIVSFLLLMGAVPAFVAGQLADRFGQLPVVMAGALVFTIGSVLEAAAPSLPVFLVGRGFTGIGEGLWLSNVTVYVTEIAPRSRRGVLVSIPQLMSTAGICAGYFTCYATIHIDSSISWRLPFIIQAIVAVILALSCYFLPKSPRWLLQNGRRDEALVEMERLEIPRLEAEKDILQSIGHHHPSTSAWRGFLSIFEPQYRRRTILGLFILGMMQLSGIDGILYYAPILFAQAGLPSGTAAFLASGASAILMLMVSIPAFLYSDSWGRRTSVISGGVILSVCMFVIGSLYATDSVNFPGSIGKWFVIILIFVFALTYVSTWGIVGKIYASEVQPGQTRAAANSLGQGLNFFTNWLVAFTTPIFLAQSKYGAYFLFGGVSVFTVIVLAIYMPETQGKSLELIQETFQKSIDQSEHSGHEKGSLFSQLKPRRIIIQDDRTNLGEPTLDRSKSKGPERPRISSRTSAFIAPKNLSRA